mmetsp:Transcript_78547/g.188427  ORF Transcript_78547/g.188427 Transcript_78547/m.188427 type:complete len:221 (-) Transcript_78547:836-1498(-)
MPHGIGIRWKLSAFHQESSHLRMISENVLCFLHHPRRHFAHVHLFAQGHRLKSRDVLAAHEDIALVLEIHCTFSLDQLFHGQQGLAIRSEDRNLFALVEGARDGGQGGKRGHDDRQAGACPDKLLVPHHETAVPGDDGDALGLQGSDSLQELHLYLLGHLSRLAEFESKSRNHLVVHFVGVAAWMIHITRSWFVVVVQSHHAELDSLTAATHHHRHGMLH